MGKLTSTPNRHSMKTYISVALFLLVVPSVLLSNIEADSSLSPQTELEYQHSITIDPLFLIFGSVILGYEYRASDRLSLEAHWGFGSMLFTDIKHYYEFGARYYLNKDPNKGLFLTGFFNGIRLQTSQKSGSVSNFFLGLGNRWMLSRILLIDAFGGIYFSGDDKITFTKVDGSTTTSVDIGGKTRMSGTARIGIVF
jgi:hypothetical protein